MEHSESQSSAEALSTLSRLHAQGSLSDDEFSRLKQKIVPRAETRQVGNTIARHRGSTLGMVVAAIIGLIVVDQLSGPILPDELYCVLGAGSSFVEPGRTEANSWSANDGCGAYRPECATGWSYLPPAEHCVHGTLWEAIQSKLKNL